MHSISFFQEVQDALVAEMKSAAAGQPTSLAFVKNPIPTTPIVPAGQTFQVIIIGGSHLRSCLVQRRIEGLVILESRKKNVPIFHTKQSLMDVLDENIDPHISALGLNFAYPMQVHTRDQRLDGKLISGTKEHTFEGLVGQNVGQQIEIEMLHRRQQKITVAVCNDTVSLGLAGLDQYSSQAELPRIAAGVVGTGCNFGLFTSSTEFVNLESGNFSNFPLSPSAQQIDANSKNPGKQLFEKEVGGKYLCDHFNVMARQAGLSLQITDGARLSNVAEHDTTQAGLIATRIITRAARFVATKIAAINQFSRHSTQQTSPLKVIIEGSVFWQAYAFASLTQDFLSELTQDSIEIVNIENSGVTGTARLLS